MLPLLVVIVGQFAVIAYLAQAYAKDRTDFLFHMRLADEGARGERADLLQRIQAPEAAVVAHTVAAYTATPEPQTLPMDDDEAFFAFKTKEQLAAELNA